MISDPLGRTLATAARGRQRHAHRPGTLAGRNSVIDLFIKFCNRLRLSYKRITYAHVCWYIEYLAKNDYSPGTISNHVSHLRTFYKLAALPEGPLHHYRVGLALRAVAVNIRHVPSPKDSVNPATLKAVLSCLQPGPNYLQVKLAILLMYMGFFRQSSLTSATVATFDPTRHLTSQDVWVTEKGLHVRLKWTKTIQRSCDAKVILMPPTQDQNLCPVRAHTQHSTASPAPSPHAPYLAFQDGRPLTTRFLARAWTQAVRDAGFSPSRLSLHSLRRGGASYTYNDAKADLNDVMVQGTWRSMAVRDYIRPADGTYNTVHDALKRL